MLLMRSPTPAFVMFCGLSFFDVFVVSTFAFPENVVCYLRESIDVEGSTVLLCFQTNHDFVYLSRLALLFDFGRSLEPPKSTPTLQVVLLRQEREFQKQQCCFITKNKFQQKQCYFNVGPPTIIPKRYFWGQSH